ncbi:MAG: hypothetical protein IJD83_06325 [Clostridia bacterium]|nr:hypothetical protein [Clostridia bacterium]
MFSEHKLEQFAKKIIKLEDRPQMSAQALKEYFDSSAEELRVKFNALIDALDSFGAASLDAVDYNAAEYKLTFTFKNGSTRTIDLPLELLIESGHYDAEKESIVLTLANSDVITVPVSDLIDEYEADEKTLHMAASETSRVFSVKEGVFASEAPADGALYARTNGDWKAIVEGLPHIRLSEADGITAGLYIVDDAFGDWGAGTSENPLTCALLIAGAELYGDDYENSTAHQMLVLPCGELWWRCNGGAWESIIPSLTGYAKTSYVDATADALKADRKLKLLKTITLEEDVSSITVDFDKPLDEISILFDVAFLKEETKAMAAHTDSGAWYMFWASSAMKTTKQLFFVHSKEFAEWRWETFASGGFFGGLQGISNSATTPKLFLSSRKRVANLNRFISKLSIFIPNNTSENAFATGSTIEIWGHEADEE